MVGRQNGLYKVFWRMKGIRTNRRTGEETEVELSYEIREGRHGPVFQLHGGPTGFENFYIGTGPGDGNPKEMSERGWCACGGCRNYDKLFIVGTEMRKAFQDLGLIDKE